MFVRRESKSQAVVLSVLLLLLASHRHNGNFAVHTDAGGSFVQPGSGNATGREA